MPDFVVYLQASVRSPRDSFILQREVLLPFPPFPGLQIRFVDSDELADGQLEDTFVVADVEWDCLDKRFRVWEEPLNPEQPGGFHAKFDDEAESVRYVRLLCDALGFKEMTDP